MKAPSNWPGGRSRFASPQESASAGIAVIHQELSLIPSLSVVDNIFLGREQCRRGGVGWTSARRRKPAGRCSISLASIVDLNRLVEEYPISVQQMIEIAKALAADARIILMDEPTSALSEPRGGAPVQPDRPAEKGRSGDRLYLA